MSMFIVLAAILPAIILTYYIYRRDTEKEPASQLVKGFGLGLVAAGLALIIEVVVMNVGLAPQKPSSVLGAISQAFLGAAIPEETAKLLMLWLLLRRNRHFDQYFDGVVYAVSIGMGFAAIENVFYLFGDIDNWVGVAAARALFSVPGHFAFAVLMGFFYSLVHIGGRHTERDRIIVLAAPVLAHGVYDAVLFSANLNPWLSGLCTIAFLLLCLRLVKESKKRIRTLRAFDSIPRRTPPTIP